MNQTGQQKLGTHRIEEGLPQEDSLYPAWFSFVYNQKILPGVQPVIGRSWKRCWSRVNPLQPARSPHLNENNFFTTQLVSFDLLSIALPILEDVQQCGQGTSTAILFANSAGCILQISGDRDILEALESCGVVQGGFVTEDQVGTNAIGLALMERMPVQVVGAEHYVQSFHQFGSAAAPLFDLTGHSLGVVGVFTTRKKYHSYALGMVMVTAKAIEGQCQSEVLMNEQNSQMAELNAVLSAISEGILVINADNVVIQANTPASQLLGMQVKNLLGRTLNPYENVQPPIGDAIHAHSPLTDNEVRINLDGKFTNVILSLRYVYNNKAIRWIIATLRPVKEVRQLVQHQMGATAAITLEDIPGNSPAIKQVREQARKAAPATASILIHGEPGTGKNALASAIHNLGPNHDGPYVIFACGSIPNELVLTDLLGFDETFFSRPVGNRPGKFELAEGGTLFFQDIDLLPLEAQNVLLNVLEMGIAQRLGSSRPIPVDCRIIASTSVDIKYLITQKGFRSDLFYRLSVFSITLPPLRERPQDIPEIITRITNRFSNQTGYKITLGAGVMEVLKKYYWPYNIREIEAVIGKTAMQVGRDGVIQIKDLPSSILLSKHSLSTEERDYKINTLDELEKQTILKTIKMCRGNVTRVSEILGISRTTLWRKMKSYSISLENDTLLEHDMNLLEETKPDPISMN
jgi:transcriptional regulator of acetoin/glycerol metabolism